MELVTPPSEYPRHSVQAATSHVTSKFLLSISRAHLTRSRSPVRQELSLPSLGRSWASHITQDAVKAAGVCSRHGEQTGL